MKASILINNYNNAEFLKECIDSALEQDYKNIEIIICDNGSTDNSMDILALYGSKVKVVENLNRTSVHSTNQYLTIVEAFKVCSGDVVFLLDSDDSFKVNKISEIMKVFLDQSVVMVQHTSYKMDEESKTSDDISPLLVKCENYLDYINDNKSILSLFAPTSAQAYKKSFLDKVILSIDDEGYDLICADLRLPYHALFNGKVIFLDKVLGYYRIHTQNDSARLRQFNSYTQFLNESIEYFEKTALKYNNKIELMRPALKMLIHTPILHRFMNLDFINELNKNDEIYIWGAGEAGIGLMYNLEVQQFKVRGFIESNPTKFGEIIEGKKVFPKNSIDWGERVKVILSPFYAANNIKKNLIEESILSEESIIIPYSETDI